VSARPALDTTDQCVVTNAPGPAVAPPAAGVVSVFPVLPLVLTV
jgi:hypothetical protein